MQLILSLATLSLAAFTSALPLSAEQRNEIVVVQFEVDRETYTGNTPFELGVRTPTNTTIISAKILRVPDYITDPDHVSCQAFDWNFDPVAEPFTLHHKTVFDKDKKKVLIGAIGCQE